MRIEAVVFGGGLCKARHGGVHEPRPQLMNLLSLCFQTHSSIPPLKQKRSDFHQRVFVQLLYYQLFNCSSVIGCQTKIWCPGRDLNPYSLAATSPSSWRVYQFHHLGKFITDHTTCCDNYLV
jgi:hypothetical protein